MKRPNPQDATRKHDVDPLRRRIKELEEKVRDLTKRMKAVEKWIANGND